jgi:hypothetical protein
MISNNNSRGRIHKHKLDNNSYSNLVKKESVIIMLVSLLPSPLIN